MRICWSSRIDGPSSAIQLRESIVGTTSIV